MSYLFSFLKKMFICDVIRYMSSWLLLGTCVFANKLRCLPSTSTHAQSTSNFVNTDACELLINLEMAEGTA